MLGSEWCECGYQSSSICPILSPHRRQALQSLRVVSRVCLLEGRSTFAVKPVIQGQLDRVAGRLMEQALDRKIKSREILEVMSS